MANNVIFITTIIIKVTSSQLICSVSCPLQVLSKAFHLIQDKIHIFLCGHWIRYNDPEEVDKAFRGQRVKSYHHTSVIHHSTFDRRRNLYKLKMIKASMKSNILQQTEVLTILYLKQGTGEVYVMVDFI